MLLQSSCCVSTRTSNWRPVEDLGDPQTSLTAKERMAIRIKDLYDDPIFYTAMSLTLAEVCSLMDWEILWERDPGTGDAAGDRR